MGGSPTGGSTTTGGSPTGGTATGGSATGGSATGGTGATASCTITSKSEISSAIATVGIVTFTTDLQGLDRARIEFGLDTAYGMTAPVDLAEPNYRTLLLGMKQSRAYHFRIVVGSGANECAGPDQTIMTGALPNILPTLDVTNVRREALFGGYFQTGQYQANGGPNAPAYILDADGDFVWAVRVGNFVTGVRQSYDGKWMWINGSDNMNTSGNVANIHRVSMDGLIDEDLSEEFGIQDHQITVLPDESVIFYGHDQDCPTIKRRYADGRIESLINARDAHGATGACHVNHVEYSPEDQTLIFSDDNHDNYTKITLEGEVVWVLGGTTSDFTGDGSSWDRQHGIDVLGLDRFVYFNNGPMMGGSGSVAHELVLDLGGMTATRVWTYTAMPRISNIQLGDVQRLPNGNTVVAYSTQGVLHEVDAQGNLLQEIVWPLGGAYGYMHKRASLYGPPPR
ncbi:MAG TPA: arylsulfotransferase family protein [Polyangiaceae bacterium]